jgi:spore maturation protein CgeB
MNVYLVHPGVPFSTSDVYDGVLFGLRANGVEVIEGRLDTITGFQAALYDAGQAAGLVTPGTVNISYFAWHYIATHAMGVQPDLILVISAHNLNLQAPRLWRKYGLKTAVIMTESPYFSAFEATMAREYDTVFTNERKAVESFRTLGCAAHYLPHAYHPAIHEPGEADPAKVSDVFFCGTLFDERKALIGGVDWTGINLVRRGFIPPGPSGERVNDTIENEETAAYYRATKVALNHHRTTKNHGSGEHISAGEAESLGPRAYEIAACGAFQLMDDSRAEAIELFGDSLTTYCAGDSKDLEARIRYWLKHDSRREETARMQHEAIKPHSWTNRARQLLEAL